MKQEVGEYNQTKKYRANLQYWSFMGDEQGSQCVCVYVSLSVYVLVPYVHKKWINISSLVQKHFLDIDMDCKTV